MNYSCDLKERIEILRSELHKLVEMYGTTDPVVLDKSIELDRMLNKFQSSNFKDGEDNITLMRG
ncbi:aspartyl-phosphate phosphatase Spo0E family protein [Paenibacillus dendritiformis]|nr:aspartyl-phosphate phosphatase Spo0E family protein [Paenibacillus dendritiformis]PZM63935.1 hypothetical protein DOE73_19445 [Paenibacillus dendritiformis]TDL58222.1 aspartyl-phosphate phosphatase Spo0E family protein [Paenibacillus dendritiformis]